LGMFQSILFIFAFVISRILLLAIPMKRYRLLLPGSVTLSLSLLSISLFSIGALIYIYGIKGLGNVMMYFMYYGAFIAYLASLLILSNIIFDWSVNKPCKHRYFLYTFLLIAALGGLIDPYTYNL